MDIKKRISYLDVIRIIACFSVIINHSNFVKEMAESGALQITHSEILGSVLLAVFCKVGVTLFLMISGAIFLRREEPYKKHFFRILRVVIVLVIFSAGYYLLGEGEHSVQGFLEIVFRKNVTLAYWYLYLYLGILVMNPILQKLVKKLEMKDYFYFFVISFGFCSFDFTTNYNTLFRVPIFTTFIGIYLLGYWLDNFKWEYFGGVYVWKIKHVSTLLVLMDVSFLTIYAYKGVLNHSETVNRFFVYDNVFYIILSAYIFWNIKQWCLKIKWDENSQRTISYVGSCTFVIYLVSDLLIRLSTPVFKSWALESRLYMPCFVIFLDIWVFTAGFVIAIIMKKIPVLGKYL